VVEGGRVGNLKLLEKGIDLQRWQELGFQHLPPLEPVEVAFQLYGGPKGVGVPRERLGADPVPEPPDGGPHGVARLLHSDSGPEEVGEPFPAHGGAPFEYEIDQECKLLLGPEPNGGPALIEEDRVA